MNDIITISDVRGYIDENGTAQLNLEDITRGLGFTQTKNGTQYIRWERVNKYLTEMGFPHLVGKEYVPENVFYRLSLKGENEAAIAFQCKIADEVLPTIRKHGAYMTPEVITRILCNPDTIIALAQQLKVANEQNAYQRSLIQGFNRELSLAEMRQVLNRVVRKVPKYTERWTELYKQFNMKFHMNVQQCARNRKMKTTLEYIESVGMLPELFDIACKLYESEVDALVEEIYGLRSA